MKRKTYDNEFKMRVVKEALQNKTYKEVAEEFGVSESMVQRWCGQPRRHDEDYRKIYVDIFIKFHKLTYKTLAKLAKVSEGTIHTWVVTMTPYKQLKEREERKRNDKI